MTFLAPWALAVGALAALGALVLHLIAWRRPPSLAFPTARFVPEGEARAASWSRWPADVALLLARMLALLLAGAAFARPVTAPRRVASARVFLVDRSRAVGAPTAAHDSLARRFRAGDRVVAFDGAATAADSAGASLRPRATRGRLGAGLVAALGAAAVERRRAERVELVLLSPLAADEVDSATLAVRALWSGPITLVRLPVAPADGAHPRIEVRASPAVGADDAIATGATLAARATTGGPTRAVRLVRAATLSSADSARAEAGDVVLWWPDAVPGAGGVGQGAVRAGDAVLVAPFARAGAVPAGEPAARWMDGTPAAAERSAGAGCVREVRVPVPPAGDLVLSPGFAAFARALMAPCGGEWSAAMAAAAPPPLVRALETAPGASAPAAEHTEPSALARWLLVGALALLLAEPLLRRGDGVAPAAEAAA